jgi:hypothetical protein
MKTTLYKFENDMHMYAQLDSDNNKLVDLYDALVEVHPSWKIFNCVVDMPAFSVRSGDAGKLILRCFPTKQHSSNDIRSNDTNKKFDVAYVSRVITDIRHDADPVNSPKHYTSHPSGTGIKADAGKPAMALLSTEALLAEAAVLTFGAQKYSANN